MRQYTELFEMEHVTSACVRLTKEGAFTKHTDPGPEDLDVWKRENGAKFYAAWELVSRRRKHSGCVEVGGGSVEDALEQAIDDAHAKAMELA